ncbi:MAG: Sporulation-control protein spo0M [Pelotomaculum sp. PtaB.Bin117]|nr:MAG: Sporulation-control protein spo0M [Pelotomaculum sp. PtaB.Bin117]OPY61401.1 MAG: Sporulation-control protein spo0M [Pelotomaculum sp. PtaU1.Bin065]
MLSGGIVLFKNLLAGLGVGAAKVDLEINRAKVALGEVIEGEVKISGGNVDQQVEKINITLVLDSRYKHDDKYVNIRREIGTLKVADSMLIKAGSPEKTIPVRLQLPYDIPVSRGKTRYYFVTNLDIKKAVDPKDIDDVVVLPNPYMQMVFDALSMLGFRDKPSSGDYNGRFQQFEYKPTKFMARELDELEFYFVAEESQLYIVMEIDKKTRGFFGKLADDMDLDERRFSYTLPYSDMHSVEQVAATLKEIIENEYRKINC